MKRLLYFLPLIAALSLGSCSNECNDCDFGPVRPRHSRIMFHYLAMDNNLSSNGRKNVADMVKGATKESMNNGAIVVFYDMPSTNSQLLYIKPGKDGAGQHTVLYDWGENLDSSDPETFKAAFAKTRELLDADSWVLAAGSHGVGWMPFAMQSKYTGNITFRAAADEQSWPVHEPYWEGAGTRALFSEQGIYMDMDEFVAALPEDIVFDFVIMDLCLMGGVEFAYAMRHNARQLVLSPAEVLAHGMPYDRILSHIFAATPRLGQGGVCEEYHKFYLNDYDGGNEFATIALYDCTKLEALADVMREIVGLKESRIGELTNNYIIRELQTLDRYPRRTMIDLREFVDYLYGPETVGGEENEEDAMLLEFDAALKAVIQYKKTTGALLTRYGYMAALAVPEERYCGVSTYIPIAEYGDLNEYYWQTEWGKTVYQK